MRKLMRLDKAIEKKIVKNLDKMDPNALFPRNLKEVILKDEITGISEPQIITRQDFEWVFFKTRVKRDVKLSMLAIGKENNKNACVSLRGKTGYLWNRSCWLKINQLYTNKPNGIIAYSLSEEDLNFLLERNKKFKGFEFPTWIEECFKELSPGRNVTKSGVKVVKERTIYKKSLWYSIGLSDEGTFNYCPLVKIYFPSDILVDLTSMKKVGKWKLIPRKGLLKWWYRLF